MDAASLGHQETPGLSLTVPEAEATYFVSAGETTLLVRRYANKQNWRH